MVLPKPKQDTDAVNAVRGRPIPNQPQRRNDQARVKSEQSRAAAAAGDRESRDSMQQVIMGPAIDHEKDVGQVEATLT